MLKCRTNEETLIKKVRQIKGKCPNFYIVGHSASAMERLGLKITETIDEAELISFKGLVRNFTIKMPYYKDQESANTFLKHLDNSYSIARDCYDTYAGTIVIELAQEWGKRGYNSFLQSFLGYIAAHPQVCFLLLVPEGKNQEQDNAFFSEFIRYGVWMKCYAHTVPVQQCVKYFAVMAEKEGWHVHADAEKLLTDRLKERSETETENIIVVEQLFRQILFEQNMVKNKSRVIRAKDICWTPGMQRKEVVRTIGFVTDYK